MEENYSEYVKLLIERYYDDVYVDGMEVSYEAREDFLYIVNAPEQYEIEDKMLEFVKQNPNVTLEQVSKYLDKIIPEGLPPCASEWDDEDDD